MDKAYYSTDLQLEMQCAKSYLWSLPVEVRRKADWQDYFRTHFDMQRCYSVHRGDNYVETRAVRGPRKPDETVDPVLRFHHSPADELEARLRDLTPGRAAAGAKGRKGGSNVVAGVVMVVRSDQHSVYLAFYKDGAGRLYFVDVQYTEVYRTLADFLETVTWEYEPDMFYTWLKDVGGGSRAVSGR